MLRIDRENKRFHTLATPSLAAASITERYDLQEYILGSPSAFFAELSQDLFLIGSEIIPSKNVLDRIDLLAVDREGACVIVELKRGNHKLQMLQAISYAGMISQWTAEDVLQLLDDSKLEALGDFLEVDREEINRQQRIMLIAEAFDYSVLIGAEWLTEQFGVSINCCKIAVAQDAQSNAEYLVCSNVYPAPELSVQAVPRGRAKKQVGPAKWSDWDSALAGISNPAVVKYFRQEVAANRERYLRRRIVRYRLAGKRRWFVAARIKNAYVWQYPRFENDIEFWRCGLSQPDDVKPVKDGKGLRMFLYTDGDFQFFHQSATSNLQSVEWSEEMEESEDPESQDE